MEGRRGTDLRGRRLHWASSAVHWNDVRAMRVVESLRERLRGEQGGQRRLGDLPGDPPSFSTEAEEDEGAVGVER